jgi:ComF family protein
MKILKFLEVIFPSHCISCEKIISREGLFCSSCWQKLQFITEPKCKICSYPFEFELSSDLICGRCLEKKPSFDKVITIFRYNEILRKIISDLKYRDQIFLAKKLARILVNKVKDEIDDKTLLAVVPLHKKRLRKRKFNQSILIGFHLKKLLPNLKFYPDLLEKITDTKPQARLTKKQRQENLKQVFFVRKKYLHLVKNKKILLLDDVMTTGTTLEKCAKELKVKDVREVVAVTLAKTAIIH